jgi:hypothetical protein
MMIPAISSTDGKPVVFLPLSIIMFVNITKNVFEDRKRAASDKKENTSKVATVDCRLSFSEVNTLKRPLGEACWSAT